MKIRMIKNRPWRGGRLEKGSEYDLPNHVGKMLVDEKSAVSRDESGEVEAATLETPRRRTPRKRNTRTTRTKRED